MLLVLVCSSLILLIVLFYYQSAIVCITCVFVHHYIYKYKQYHEYGAIDSLSFFGKFHIVFKQFVDLKDLISSILKGQLTVI